MAFSKKLSLIPPKKKWQISVGLVKTNPVTPHKPMQPVLVNRGTLWYEGVYGICQGWHSPNTIAQLCSSMEGPMNPIKIA